MINILVINGPNINLLGKREPEIYGTDTYDDLLNLLSQHAEKININIECFISNNEGEIVSAIQNALGKFDGIVINAAAYSHTSIAIMDAISAVNIPCIDVHISNIYARESFRHISHIASVAIGQISGFGFNSYILALDALKDYICKTQKN